MEKYLKMATKAMSQATIDVKRLADAYVGALKEFGDSVKVGFCKVCPMFGDREWSRLRQIGENKLLPQFIFKSDVFVGRLLRLRDSMKWQKALVSASPDGTLRVDRGRGPERVHLSNLSKDEWSDLVFLMNDADADLSTDSLQAKFRSMIVSVNKQTTRHPTWEVVEQHGRCCVRFNHACTLDRAEIARIHSALNTNASGTSGIGASGILSKLVDAIVELEAARDDEWEFEENHGPNRDCWSAREMREHESVVNRVIRMRKRVRDLARRATGDSKLEV